MAEHPPVPVEKWGDARASTATRRGVKTSARVTLKVPGILARGQRGSLDTSSSLREGARMPTEVSAGRERRVSVVEARSATLRRELGLRDLVLTQIMYVVGSG